MKQTTLAVSGFEKHSRATRKAEFLSRMETLMPWAEFCALIEPHYLNPFLDPKAGNGRPPIGLERMLRMYCIANWFSLAMSSTKTSGATWVSRRAVSRYVWFMA